MKKYAVYIFGLFFLTACAVTNRLYETFDRDTKQTSLVLKQTLKAFADKKPDQEVQRETNRKKITAVFAYNEQKDKRPVVSVSFNTGPNANRTEADSVMILLLEHEKFRIICDKTEPSGSGKGKKSIHPGSSVQFTIPENLWVSVVHAGSIGYQLSQAGNKIEVEHNHAETLKLKEFFRRAILLRDMKFPALPEGLKKW